MGMLSRFFPSPALVMFMGRRWFITQKGLNGRRGRRERMRIFFCRFSASERAWGMERRKQVNEMWWANHGLLIPPTICPIFSPKGGKIKKIWGELVVHLTYWMDNNGAGVRVLIKQDCLRRRKWGERWRDKNKEGKAHFRDILNAYFQTSGVPHFPFFQMFQLKSLCYGRRFL